MDLNSGPAIYSLCVTGKVISTLWTKSLGKPKNTGVDSLSLLQRIFPTQGMNPGLPHCRWILCVSPGKPKNTGVDSLSLLQQIFPAQELKLGLLHFRWILYQ